MFHQASIEDDAVWLNPLLEERQPFLETLRPKLDAQIFAGASAP